MMKRAWGLSVSITVALMLFVVLGQAVAQKAPFYQGKTIRVIVGYPPGGGYDTYSRILARHMGKYIPGNPKFIVQNMPGAGSLVAANYLYGVAKPDGLTFGTFSRGITYLPLLGEKAAKLDAQKYTWLGTSSSYENDAYVLIVRPDAGPQTIQDLQKSGGKPLHLGAASPGSSGHDIPVILKEALKLNMTLVPGYRGTADLNLAIERKEIDGRTLGLSAIKASKKEWMDDKKMLKLVQVGRKTRHPALPDTPLAREMAKDPKDRELIDFVEAAFFMGRPYLAPPGVPAERAKILQAAFMKTHEDPGYLKEAGKLGVDVSPKTAEQIQELLVRMSQTSPELLKRYKKLLDIK